MQLPKQPSRIGRGWVRHRRSAVKAHSFRYPLFMPLLDLDRVEETLDQSPFWSAGRANIASHRRADFFGDPTIPLKTCVLDAIEKQLGARPNGQVLQLAHSRYFGHSFNPISLYFCFDQDGQLRACLAEVNNTPWGENILYAMPVTTNPTTASDGEPVWKWQHSNDKGMHVSPFLPMNMHYRWTIELSAKTLLVHIENWSNDRNAETSAKAFDATLNLDLHPADRSQLNSVLWRYPLMTMKVVAGIHWQALRLWAKGVPYLPKPSNNVHNNT